MAADAVFKALDYVPSTGGFVWKERRGRARAGDIAGHVWKCPKRDLTYVVISYDSKRYLAHRLAWFIHYGVWPTADIDHIDGDGTNNKITNLREASNQENSKNSRLYVTNKSGIPGVRKHDANRYRAYITVNGKTTHIGLYNDFFEAACARKAAENKYGYHSNHGRR